jgi:hypothetical protein
VARKRHSGESRNPAREAQKENHDYRIGEGSGCFRASGASWIPAFAGMT